jgi:hypothetical protein
MIKSIIQIDIAKFTKLKPEDWQKSKKHQRKRYFDIIPALSNIVHVNRKKLPTHCKTQIISDAVPCG